MLAEGARITRLQCSQVTFGRVAGSLHLRSPTPRDHDHGLSSSWGAVVSVHGSQAMVLGSPIVARRHRS